MSSDDDSTTSTTFNNYGSVTVTSNIVDSVLTIETIQQAVNLSLTQFGNIGPYTVSSMSKGVWHIDPLNDIVAISTEHIRTIHCLIALRKLKLLPENLVFDVARDSYDYGERMRAYARREIKLKKLPVVKEHPFKKFADPSSKGKSFNPRLKF